jgi:hypothetical protein
MTGVRSVAQANNFSSSLCVQTSPETHPASYPMGAVAHIREVFCYGHFATGGHSGATFAFVISHHTTY